MADRNDDHAVVIGGSMAGLLAARVLAEAYARVTVVDRDDLAPSGAPRRGVPQGRHIHALLAGGQQALEELFPGLTRELAAHGAPVGDVLGDARLLFGGHRLARAEAGLTVVSASRPLLEERVRARVRALPRVTSAPRADVAGLRASPDGGRVTGVRLVQRADGSAAAVLGADLVVDASGRGSRAPAWLDGLGFGRPGEDRVHVGVRYATRRYRLPARALGGDLACIHGPAPDRPRGGALARLEGDMWMVTVFGLLGDDPPTDPEGFLAFARSLPFPDLHEALRGGEPVDDPVAFAFPANLRRRYERMRRLPEGFLVMGDALCSFNPVYGQGMTVAAQQALALREQLTGGDSLDCRRALRSIAAVVDIPWRLTVGADFALPGVAGRRPAGTRVMNRYVARLQAAAAHDPAVARAFVRVTGLVDRPEALLRPAIARRVLRRGVGRAGASGGRELPITAPHGWKQDTRVTDPATPSPSTPEGNEMSLRSLLRRATRMTERGVSRTGGKTRGTAQRTRATGRRGLRRSRRAD
jgi:2-polyprenyl-6-methoxyphenol hydroxylase-like FAD-dependent oxidoreductase